MTKNQSVPPIEAVSISGETISLCRLFDKKVLIKFHRFSGCPVAQQQIHELIEGQPQLNRAGIETIVFLHSKPQHILANFSEVPGLHLVADPEKKLMSWHYGRHFGDSWPVKEILEQASAADGLPTRLTGMPCGTP